MTNIAPMFFPYARSLRGPIAPSILDPPRLPTTNLAASAPAPILIIVSLFVLNALDKVVNATAGPSLPSACFTAVPAFAASRNARPAPVSIRLTEKDRFLRAVLFFRLGAMFVLVGVLPTGTPRYSLLSNYLNLVSQLPHLVGSMCSRFFLR